MKLFIFILILLLLSLTIDFLTFHFPLKYYDYVKIYAKKFGFDPLFVMAVIKAESNFDHSATSPVGAYGLMQVMPKTCEWMNERFGKNFGITTPASNIEAGLFYLKYLYEKYYNLDDALQAYNVGPYAHNIGTRRDASKRYLNKVKKYYIIYKLLYEPLSLIRDL